MTISVSRAVCLSLLWVSFPLVAETKHADAPRTRRPVLEVNATTKTVDVDCTKNGSIARALEDNADVLIVQVHGICQENVAIHRDNVTLTGTDRTTDGVRGEPGVTRPVVRVHDAFGVVIQDLRITEGAGHGLQSQLANTTVRRCDIVTTGGDGVQAANGAIFATDLTVSGAGRAGVSAFDGDLFCTNCTISNARFGAFSIVGSRVQFSSSNVQANEFSLLAEQNGWIEAIDSTISGSLDAFDKSTILLTRSTHTADTVENIIDNDSTLRVQRSSVTGSVNVSGFSSLILANQSSLSGDLACDLGGDAFCPGGGTGISGTVTGCDKCTKP